LHSGGKDAFGKKEKAEETRWARRFVRKRLSNLFQIVRVIVLYSFESRKLNKQRNIVPIKANQAPPLANNRVIQPNND
jgi:hypothetical protein